MLNSNSNNVKVMIYHSDTHIHTNLPPSNLNFNCFCAAAGVERSALGPIGQLTGWCSGARTPRTPRSSLCFHQSAPPPPPAAVVLL